MSSKPNVGRMMDALSAILTEKYGCKITLKAIQKETTAVQVEKKAG